MGGGPGMGRPQGPGPFNPNPVMPNPNDPNVQKQKERENWVEYKTSDQVSFYCNIRTGKTTFKRPPELDLPKEQLLEEPEPQKIDVTKLAANTKRDQIQFKEIQTVVKPKEKTSWVHVAKQEVEAIESSIKVKKKPPPVVEESMYETQEERVNAFKELLKDQGLTTKDKWEQFLRKIIKDQRYQAIKTLKERKAVFTAYQDEIAEARHQSRKEAKRKLKQDYLDLLSECDRVKPGKRFHQFVGSIEKDSRYKAVRNSEDRERWAYDYIEDLERKEKERRDSAKKALKDAFSSFDFTHQSTWRDCEKNFGDNETFKTKDLNTVQKKEVFQELIDDLRRAKEKEERKKREEKRAKEQKEENDFIELLKEHGNLETPLFHAKTQWVDYSSLDAVKDDPRFTIFKDERKNVPYKRFEKFCWKVDGDMKNEKKALKRVFRKKDFVIKADHEFTALVEEVKPMTKEANIAENHLKLLLLEMIAKAKFKEEQEKEREEMRLKKEKEREKEKEKQLKKEKEREEKRAKRREKEKKKDRSSKEDKEKKKKNANENGILKKGLQGKSGKRKRNVKRRKKKKAKIAKRGSTMPKRLRNVSKTKRKSPKKRRKKFLKLIQATHLRWTLKRKRKEKSGLWSWWKMRQSRVRRWMKNEKKALKRVFRKKDFVIKADHEFTALVEEVKPMTKEANIAENHLKLLLLEMIAKAKFKEEQEKEREEKRLKKEKEREKEKEKQLKKEKEREEKRAKRREKEKKKD